MCVGRHVCVCEANSTSSMVMKAAEVGIDLVKSNISHLIADFKHDIEAIQRFESTLAKAKHEDADIEEELRQEPKYQKFQAGLQELLRLARRILDLCSLLRNVSQNHVFDFDSLADKLKDCLTAMAVYADQEAPQALDLPLNTAIEATATKSKHTCGLCCQYIIQGTQYEGESYHTSCLNYWLHHKQRPQ